jgi:hypothetical protein
MAKKKEEMLSVSEAARRLGVDKKTVRSWARSGRLGATIKKVQIVQERIYVKASTLDDAFKVTCRQCGKVFESSHPEKAQFCCKKHYDKFHLDLLRAEKAKLAAREKAKAKTGARRTARKK